MGRVHQYDNRVNITYVYDVEEVYDIKTGKSRQKRRLIGKLDPETKELVPTGKRGRPAGKSLASADSQKEDAQQKEEQLKNRFLETIRLKDETITALKDENRQLKAALHKLEKAVFSINAICSDVRSANSQRSTE